MRPRLASVILPRLPDAAAFRAAARIHRSAGPTPPRQITLADGSTFELTNDDWAQGQTLLLRRYSERVVRKITLRQPKIVVDAGAHVGLVAFQIAARVSSVSIHAFEPHPQNAARFRRNAQLNPLANVKLTEAALGEAPRSLSFDLDSNSVSAADFTVPALALDDYLDAQRIDSVSALKIDVEGHELPVLRGARRLLAAGGAELVVVELMPAHRQRVGTPAEEIIGFLGRFGYRQKWAVGEDVGFSR